MKTRAFSTLGIVLLFLVFACSKDSLESSEELQPELLTAKHKKKNLDWSVEAEIYDPYSLISPSAHDELTPIQNGFGFTEGPAVDKHGNVFFTDQPNDRIYKWSARSGHVSLFLEGTGRANGMAFDKDGNLIACADLHGELWKIFPDGTYEVLIDNYNGKLLNGPNDVWINPVTGGMYITDPIFPRDYWEEGDPRIQPWEPTHSEQAETGKGGHVYYLAPGASELVRVTTMAEWNDDSWPNGVVGSPDGTKLYVNQWHYDGTGGVFVFDINPDGSLSNLQDFVPGLNFCDGMSMDDEGNVYVSSGGIKVYAPDGENIMNIDMPDGATNNVFAGQNNKELFITSVPFVSSIKMNVKGVEKFSGRSGHGNGGHHHHGNHRRGRGGRGR
ncbi:MAG: SMP-30/gluconolactonase/LRE family protein [Allomuricauda sp.]